MQKRLELLNKMHNTITEQWYSLVYIQEHVTQLSKSALCHLYAIKSIISLILITHKSKRCNAKNWK